MLRQHLRIPKDDQSIFRAGEGNIQTARIAKETDALVIVGTDAGKHNEILFSSLEGVNRCNFNLLIVLLFECAICLHRLDNIAPLALVWSDDTDVLRLNSSLEKASDNLFNVGSFRAVQVRSTGGGDLFIAQIRPEHHGRIGDWP